MKQSTNISLIVGLGNIGQAYKNTRHNVGFQALDRLADALNATFKTDKKFLGEIASVTIHEKLIFLLKPSTLMNLSGHSVSAVCNFFKLKSEQLLVIHDELDLKPGMVKFKFAGGTAGHNGLKSIVGCLGTPNFYRLRIGIGHPRDKAMQIPVADYVLSKPSLLDQNLIANAIQTALEETPLIIDGNFQDAVSKINEKKHSD